MGYLANRKQQVIDYVACFDQDPNRIGNYYAFKLHKEDLGQRKKLYL